MGYRRILPNLVLFVRKLNSGETFTYFQLGTHSETASLHPIRKKINILLSHDVITQ